MSGDVCPGYSRATALESVTLCIDQFPPFEGVLGANVVGRAEQTTNSFLRAPS